MSPSWPHAELGQLLTERREDPVTELMADGSIRMVEKIGFNDGRIYLREGNSTRTKMIVIRPGDLVLSGINAAKGAIAVYDDGEKDPVAATIHYSTYEINRQRVDPRYLWWFLRSATFRTILARHLPNGIKTELRSRRLFSIAIPLPSLSDQTRIVEKIEAHQVRTTCLHEHRRCGTMAATDLMTSAIDAAMSRVRAQGVFGDIVTFKPRSGPSFAVHPDWGGTPVLMPSSVTGFGVDLTKVEYGMGNEVVSEKDRLDPGDIIIARGNKPRQVGDAGVVPSEAKAWVCANLLMRMKVDSSRVDAHYCIYWLRSPRMRSLVKSSMTGTNPKIQKITQKKILAFPFPTELQLDDQRTIVRHLDRIQGICDQMMLLQTRAAKLLDDLFPSILNRAFEGEL